MVTSLTLPIAAAVAAGQAANENTDKKAAVAVAGAADAVGSVVGNAALVPLGVLSAPVICSLVCSWHG